MGEHTTDHKGPPVLNEIRPRNRNESAIVAFTICPPSTYYRATSKVSFIACPNYPRGYKSHLLPLIRSYLFIIIRVDLSKRCLNRGEEGYDYRIKTKLIYIRRFFSDRGRNLCVLILEKKKKRGGKKEREPNPNIVVAVVNGCVTAARFRSRGRACSLFHSQISGTAIERASYLHERNHPPGRS